MESEDYYVVKVILLLFSILIAICAIYYYNTQLDTKNIKTYVPHDENVFKNNYRPFAKIDEPKYAKPQTLVKLYDEEPVVFTNKNSIDFDNKNVFNIYKNGDTVKNIGFDEEIIIPYSQEYKKHSKFEEELEDVYNTDLVESEDPTYDYYEIFNYSIKPNKSDLPIANVPLCVLNDESKSLKLSDRIHL
jgi:hypothetical protein